MVVGAYDAGAAAGDGSGVAGRMLNAQDACKRFGLSASFDSTIDHDSRVLDPFGKRD